VSRRLAAALCPDAHGAQHAHAATDVIVIGCGPSGTTAALIPMDRRGVSALPLDSMAADRLFEVTFDGVAVEADDCLCAPGAGAALVVGGVVAGFMARSAKDDLESKQNTLGYVDYYPDQSDKVQNLALTSDVLTTAGVVTLGVGGFLWFRGRNAPLAVAPVIAPGHAGIVAAASF